MSRWIALFSQTGSELERLIEETGRTPYMIITDNDSYDGPLPNIERGSVNSINYFLTRGVKRGDVITLHGYLRIVPERVLQYLQSLGVTVYNGHPAPINIFDEYKGKDPQERMWKAKCPMLGTVIHEVTPEVDGGKIIIENYKTVEDRWSKEEYMQEIRELSSQAWLKFLKNMEVY